VLQNITKMYLRVPLFGNDREAATDNSDEDLREFVSQHLPSWRLCKVLYKVKSKVALCHEDVWGEWLYSSIINLYNCTCNKSQARRT
jgi:hypothetical protein